MNLCPVYDADGVTIYKGDCREIARALHDRATVDLLLSDPPYGMKANTDSRRFTGGDQGAKRYGQGRGDWLPIDGDDAPFDPAQWVNDYPRAILWGSNHYAQRLPVGTTLIWLKKQPALYGTFLSDAEIGWDSKGHGVYCYYKQFPGSARAKESGVTGKSPAHPTQKPLGLMTWCIERAKLPPGALILDPYMGSGTTLIAARALGYRVIGIELYDRYIDVAVKRLAQKVLI